MTDLNIHYCYYSGLPSPMDYMPTEEKNTIKSLTPYDIDRIVEMAWEDRTPFDAIYQQFHLNQSEVKILMKKHLKFTSYKRWLKRIQNRKTKHVSLRSTSITRFKSKLQRTITHNKISKRK